MPYVMGEFQKLFNARLQKKQYDQIISAANKLLQSRPNETVAFSGLAMAYFQKKDYGNYLKYAEILYQKDPNPTLAYYMDDAAINIKDSSRAEKYLTPVERGGTLLMKIDLISRLYKLYVAENNTSEAINKAEKLIALLEANPSPPNDFKGGNWNTYKNNILQSCYDFMASHYISNKDYGKALAFLQRLSNMNPKDASLHFRMGMAFWLNGKASMAAPELAMAVVLEDGTISPRAEKQLKELLQRSGNEGQALTDKYNQLIDDAKTRLNIP
jgi:tetratricopeptide (TPR) repeat protein